MDTATHLNIFELTHDPETATWLLMRWSVVDNAWRVDARFDSATLDFLALQLLARGESLRSDRGGAYTDPA